jgi:hypothetical protein
LKIAGVRVGVSVHADVTISGNKLSVEACACVDLLFDEVCACVTFSLGSLDPPGAPTAPPPPVLATMLPGNVLRLNMGSYASARNAADLLDIRMRVSPFHMSVAAPAMRQ